MSHANDSELHKTRNTARFFTENRHISWVLLLGTILWGIFGYQTMPKRKDPDIPIRQAVAIATWPGASAEMVEDRLTRVIEEELGDVSKIERIESTTRAGVAVITVALDPNVPDVPEALDEVWLRLSHTKGLPDGANVEFIKDFGDTTALMLTIASPPAADVELQMRAERIAASLMESRRHATTSAVGERAALVLSFPLALDPEELRALAGQLARWAEARGAEDARVIDGPGFLAIDTLTQADDAKILTNAREFVTQRLRATDIHPDVWPPFVVRDVGDTEQRLRAVAGDRYSYRDLDEWTEQMVTALRGVPEVAKVSRAGVLGDAVYVDYSQEKLATFGITPAQIQNVIAARNVVARGGVLELGGKTVLVAPAGEFTSEEEIASLPIAKSKSGDSVHLRDVASITRGYESPGHLAFASWKDADGSWRRTRAISIAITMRPGLQVADFGAAVERKLEETRPTLPEDLVVTRVSDQPEQVRENVDLFMSSLYEAIALVVLVALLGFWEWRSAVLMALSIPITLAMTFGMMRVLGIDVQQISIASLIIALGLLVDDPVVAGDAIKRELARGVPRILAAWVGPTKLAHAILFATITNIVAYLPFLTLGGDTGRFIFSLPIVLTCSLVASRLVSMTFIPLLGYLLLRPSKKKEPTPEERRGKGAARHYYRAVGWAIQHRWITAVASVVLLVVAGLQVRGVKQAFFPKDLTYLAYVDVWLPEDAPFADTRAAAVRADAAIRETADAHTPGLLRSVTTFVGGGGPRFWFSVAPEQRQANYAQLVLRVGDKHATSELVTALQATLGSRVPGARVDVRELESGPLIGVPVSFRIAGEDVETLRAAARRMYGILESTPNAERVRDSWGADNLGVRLEVDADRASASGVTHADVAESSSTALNGRQAGRLHEGDHSLPIVTRLRAAERQRLDDVENLYVHATQGSEPVPLRQIAHLTFERGSAKILRRNHVRTITIGAFPVAGRLPSEVMAEIAPQIEEVRASLPPGYSLTVGGEQEEQTKSFAELVVVLLISVAAIFVALVLQFRNAVKPLIVFAAIPFGVVAALLGLRIMNAPFGFMAFLGVVSLIGVIVSHVIVLFDFIEESREAGAPLIEALLDAGVVRLRPVLVTVGATVLGLVPLAAHGGPLWEPLCWVQIAGLVFATVVTLVLVPVLYAIFVLDLRLVRWEREEPAVAHDPQPTEHALA